LEIAMKKLTKDMLRGGLVAAGSMTLAPMAAYGGEWRIDFRECPDLREDRQDFRRDRGWADRRENYRDARVIRCLARAWHYVRYEGENRYYIPPRPLEIIVYRDGRGYYRDQRGALVHIDADLGLGLGLRLGQGRLKAKTPASHEAGVVASVQLNT
jgi:hypothetical protein